NGDEPEAGGFAARSPRHCRATLARQFNSVVNNKRGAAVHCPARKVLVETARAYVCCKPRPAPGGTVQAVAQAGCFARRVQAGYWFWCAEQEPGKSAKQVCVEEVAVDNLRRKFAAEPAKSEERRHGGEGLPAHPKVEESNLGRGRANLDVPTEHNYVAGVAGGGKPVGKVCHLALGTAECHACYAEQDVHTEPRPASSSA